VILVVKVIMKLRILSIGLLAFILIAGCEETKRIFSAPRAVPAFDLKINLAPGLRKN